MNGNSDALTRAYLDRFAIAWRHLNPTAADTACTLLGKRLATPIMAGGMAHYQALHSGGAALFAQGVAAAGSAMWTGFCFNEEMEQIIASGAPAVRIIKPFADQDIVLRAIAHDAAAGAWAFAMDVDHAYDKKGGVSNFFGQPLAPQTRESLAEYAAASELPFFVKGVLSAHDAEICAKAGVAGIVVSHHQNMFPWSVPPLAVLPEIRKAVGEEMCVVVDCGMESGYDVFKALALGADAVCVARPLRNSFAEGGAEGVQAHLQRMTEELRVCLLRTGSSDPGHIDPSVLYPL